METTRTASQGRTSAREQRLLASLSVYGAYHYAFWNRVVHVVFVPLIWWCEPVNPPPRHWRRERSSHASPCGELRPRESARAEASLPRSAALALHATGPLGGYAAVDGAALFWLVCAGLYTYLELPAGAAAAAFYLLLLLHSSRLYASLGREAALKVALLCQGVSWFAQVFVGHALVEKRRPALADSLFASLFLAPLFVVLEVAFALGYKPPLHAALLAQTQRELGKLRVRDKR